MSCSFVQLLSKKARSTPSINWQARNIVFVFGDRQAETNLFDAHHHPLQKNAKFERVNRNTETAQGLPHPVAGLGQHGQSPAEAPPMVRP